MISASNSRSRKFGMPLLAVGEWLMILPASILLAVAFLRQLQPAQQEPARTSWIIFNWIASHITHPEAAMIFLALPSAALLAGVVALAHLWLRDEDLRRDVSAAFALITRNVSFGVLALGTILGGLILAAVVVHLIVG